MDEKIQLFMVTHKYEENTIFQERKYIHVGNGVRDDAVSDNIGDNITFKNKNYCELTAIYWIWKNVKCDVVGIEHYRRIFGFDIKNKKQFFAISKRKINKILKRFDIICPKKFTFKDTLLNRYVENFDQNDFFIVRDIIQKKYPEYINSFDKVMDSRSAYLFNMMICNKKMFDSYCEWLFDILSELEVKIDVTKRDDYRARVFGFISERLLNVWIDYNKLRVKENPYFMTDTSVHKSIKNYIHNILYSKVIKLKIVNKNKYKK